MTRICLQNGVSTVVHVIRLCYAPNIAANLMESDPNKAWRMTAKRYELRHRRQPFAGVGWCTANAPWDLLDTGHEQNEVYA